jgi:putative spermidine/putrescine transport system permease protein
VDGDHHDRVNVGIHFVAPSSRAVATMKRRNILAKLVLVVVGLFYVLPMISMARFAFQRVPVALLGWNNLFDKWTIRPLFTMMGNPIFQEAAFLSVRLAVLSALLTLIILVPTVVYVHVSMMRARPLIEVISVLPFVVPAIALVVGISGAFRELAPWFIRSDYSLVPFYVIIALPYTFRTIDNGLSSIDVKTLVDASRSLGASWTRTMWSVIVPNIRVSVVTASFLTMTVVLGEFTIASLLLKETLPLILAQSQGRDPQGSFAVGLVLLIMTASLLGLANRFSRRRNITQPVAML